MVNQVSEVDCDSSLLLPPTSEEILLSSTSMRLTSEISKRLALVRREISRPFTFLLLAVTLVLLVDKFATVTRPLSLNTNKSSSTYSTAADDLYNTWSTAYGLNNDDPPSSISYRYPFFPAPHLQDCHRLTLHRQDLEQSSSPGQFPDWATDGGPAKPLRPPWIKGGDEDNLPYTRYVQTKIWRNQFPPNCSDPSVKFAVFEWLPMEGHGLGSALHVWSTLLTRAMGSGRVLVPLPGTFSRANHSSCEGSSHGSLSCYFFPMTSMECQERAIFLWNTRPGRKVENAPVVNLGKGKRVRLRRGWYGDLQQPWMEAPMTAELLGKMVQVVDKVPRKAWFRPEDKIDERYIRTGWWHAQAIRFVLRWPSKRLCHFVNKVRHESYGREVAGMVLEAHRGQIEAEERAVEAGPLDGRAVGKAMNGTDSMLGETLWWDQDPYVPRPIVSVHVRQGDKGSEMELFSFPSYMWLAERLRYHVPNLRHVWLSTEMETVIQESNKFSGWNFLYTKNKRQVGNRTMFEYTMEVGVKELTDISLANLIIASECDYFVGALASNWNRLINELRLTNGKLKSGIVTVNIDEC